VSFTNGLQLLVGVQLIDTVHNTGGVSFISAREKHPYCLVLLHTLKPRIVHK
jgi:hypothetical protein